LFIHEFIDCILWQYNSTSKTTSPYLQTAQKWRISRQSRRQSHRQSRLQRQGDKVYFSLRHKVCLKVRLFLRQLATCVLLKVCTTLSYHLCIIQLLGRSYPLYAGEGLLPLTTCPPHFQSYYHLEACVFISNISSTSDTRFDITNDTRFLASFCQSGSKAAEPLYRCRNCIFAGIYRACPQPGFVPERDSNRARNHWTPEDVRRESLKGNGGLNAADGQTEKKEPIDSGVMAGILQRDTVSFVVLAPDLLAKNDDRRLIE
jgi:hypothetical protein